MPIQFDCPLCGKRTQAPEELAGKKARCPLCKGVIRVPEGFEVVDEAPPRPAASRPATPRPSAPRQADDSAEERRRPCPMCGELIREEAVRCRYCGEEFDDDGPKRRPRRRRRRSSMDGELSAGEWVLAILCSGIGCIVGIVYMIQGNPKGTKMFGISFGMVVVWNIVKLIIGAALKH